MTGTIRWNILLGASAFVLTFIVSVSRNVLQTTLLRGFYSFLLVFILVFVFRFLLHFILNISPTGLPLAADETDAARSGIAVDLFTPGEEDSLHGLLRTNLDDSSGQTLDEAEFVPLKPPKLASKPVANPDDLANAIRRMSEK